MTGSQIRQRMEARWPHSEATLFVHLLTQSY